MTKIQPFGDRVTIEVICPEEIVGGLIVPTSKEKSNKGKVVAVGDGDEAKKIKVGDVVIFPIGMGLNYTTEEADFKVLNVRDILGKVIGE